MTIDDGTLGAYLDGALDADTRAQVTAELARDPALAARLAELEALNARLRTDFAAIAVPPAPALRTTSYRMAAMALAAGLAGVALGLFGAPLLRSDRMIAHIDGELRASGALAAALEGAPSGAQSRGVAVVYTVQTGDGTWCRAFHMAAERAQGAACRGEDGWRVLVLASAQPTVEGYTPAESGEPAAVSAAMEAQQAGAPLGRDEEQRLIGRRWRAP